MCEGGRYVRRLGIRQRGRHTYFCLLRGIVAIASEQVARQQMTGRILCHQIRHRGNKGILRRPGAAPLNVAAQQLHTSPERTKRHIEFMGTLLCSTGRGRQRHTQRCVLRGVLCAALLDVAQACCNVGATCRAIVPHGACAVSCATGGCAILGRAPRGADRRQMLVFQRVKCRAQRYALAVFGFFASAQGFNALCELDWYR